MDRTGRSDEVRSEEQDRVDGERELALFGVVLVERDPLRPVVPRFRPDPDIGFGLVDEAERHLVDGISPQTIPRPLPWSLEALPALVAEDFRPPHAGQLVGEAVEEPVGVAVPAVVAIGPGAAAARDVGL